MSPCRSFTVYLKLSVPSVKKFFRFSPKSFPMFQKRTLCQGDDFQIFNARYKKSRPWKKGRLLSLRKKVILQRLLRRDILCSVLQYWKRRFPSDMLLRIHTGLYSFRILPCPLLQASCGLSPFSQPVPEEEVRAEKLLQIQKALLKHSCRKRHRHRTRCMLPHPLRDLPQFWE